MKSTCAKAISILLLHVLPPEAASLVNSGDLIGNLSRSKYLSTCTKIFETRFRLLFAIVPPLDSHVAISLVAELLSRFVYATAKSQLIEMARITRRDTQPRGKKSQRLSLCKPQFRPLLELSFSTVDNKSIRKYKTKRNGKKVKKKKTVK